MEIHWLFLLPALGLLFYPLDNWLGGRFRLRDYPAVREDETKGPRVWWRQPEIQLDPLRAAAGAWLLRHGWVLDPAIPGGWSHLPLLGALAVLSLAVTAQMHTRHNDDSFFAPVGYLAGLVFGLLPPEIAVLVVASGIACLMAFRRWSAFFLFGSAAAGAFGFMILRLDFWVIATGLLLIQPLVMSVFAQRILMLPTRSRRVVHAQKRVSLSPAKAAESSALEKLPEHAEI